MKAYHSERKGNYNINFPFESILTHYDEFSDYFFKTESFNDGHLATLLDHQIYVRTHKNKTWDQVVADNYTHKISNGFDNFSRGFLYKNSQYTLTRKVDEDVNNKLKYFYTNINPSLQFTDTYREMELELSKIKELESKLEYLENYRNEFVAAYHSDETSRGVFHKLDICKEGYLKNHLLDKIWNYENSILRDWGMTIEIEEFISKIDILIMENRMLSQGKMILDNNFTARQKIILLDKIARMEVSKWEENGSRKQAKIFGFILPNSDSYILDVLKEINSSSGRDKIERDYKEIDDVFQNIAKRANNTPT